MRCVAIPDPRGGATGASLRGKDLRSRASLPGALRPASIGWGCENVERFRVASLFYSKQTKEMGKPSRRTASKDILIHAKPKWFVKGPEAKLRNGKVLGTHSALTVSHGFCYIPLFSPWCVCMCICIMETRILDLYHGRDKASPP